MDNTNIEYDYITIKEIYDNDKLYDFHFESYINTIFLKPVFMYNKYNILKNLIKKFDEKNIVILNSELLISEIYSQIFDDFKIYSDVKNAVYDIDIYKKLIIQINEFYKIRGKIDLLIMDELTCTFIYLMEKSNYKNAICDTLLEYISDINNKILVIDTFLDNWILELFYNKGRIIHYIEFGNIGLYNKILYKYDNVLNFIDTLLIYLRNNKKIIIPTNSKKFLDNIEEKILKEIPNIKYKFINSENIEDMKDQNLDDYNLIGYTTSLVSNFKHKYFNFNKCFAYFNNLEPVEFAIKQISLIQNMNDELHICIIKKDNNIYTIDDKDIDKLIINEDKCLSNASIYVKTSKTKKIIIKDFYYHLYKNIQIRLFNSKNYYKDILINYLVYNKFYEVKVIK